MLITGASGNLGSELSKLYPKAAKPSHKELDIIDRYKVFKFIAENRPRKIIHLAALVGIRECEENRELAWKTNVLGTKNLVDACLKYKSKVYFAYMSTPCVFSGNPKEAPFFEDSIPYPKNFYSLTKLIGECIVRFSGLENKLIIRGNFVPRKKWPYEGAFTDRWGTYLFADQLAKAIKEVVNKKLTGIVHLVGDKKISMYELAKMCPDSKNVKPITLKDYKGPPLTQDMSLDTKVWHKYSISD